MGELKFIGGLLMATLFAIAIISYMVGFGNDNSASINLANDAELTGLNTNLKGNVSSFIVRYRQYQIA